MKKIRLAICVGCLLAASFPQYSVAASLVPGFNASSLPANDDNSTGFVSLGFNFNFFGNLYSGTYVNNNGNITFGQSLGTYTPTGLNGANGGIPIIAPFFADVDTTGSGSSLVSYGTGTYQGHNAFGVNYPGVGYFSAHTDKLNTFQLLLVDRSDIAIGDGDIYFNYGAIKFETGDASGGINGLGGNSARAGYSNGTGIPGSFFELAGSGINGAFLDTGPNALIAASNVGVPGEFLFNVRGGAVTTPPVDVPPPVSTVPEPTTIALLGLGLLGFVGSRRRI